MPARSGPDAAVAIVVAGPESVSAMLPLIEAHARYEHSAATCTADALRTALAGPDAQLFGWIALDTTQRAIGYATATRDYSTWSGRPFLNLDCLFVSQAARGEGVGTRLLDTVRRFAERLGITELQWQTPEWNVSAERFYLRQGATVLGKRRFQLET